MIYNRQQKAQILITYLLSGAATLQSGCDIFNLCAGSIPCCNCDELCEIGDTYL